MSEVSIEEINNLLKEREKQIGSMEATTKSSREKLRKINADLDKQQQILMDIITLLTKDETEMIEIGQIISYDSDIDIEYISEKIKNVQDILRLMKYSLAKLIRKVSRLIICKSKRRKCNKKYVYIGVLSQEKVYNTPIRGHGPNMVEKASKINQGREFLIFY